MSVLESELRVLGKERDSYSEILFTTKVIILHTLWYEKINIHFNSVFYFI